MNISHLKSLTFLHQRSLNVNTMVLLLATYFAVLFNQPIIQKVYALSGYDLPLYFISHLLLLAAFVIIFSLLAWPYVFKIIFIPLVLSSALAFYASSKYNVMFDYTMIENIFETNSNESVSYINISSVSWFIVLGLLPALLLLKIKITYNGSLLKMLFMKAVFLCSSMLVILLIAVFYYKDYASIGRNNAYLNKMINPAHVYNTYKYIKKNYFNKTMPYSLLGQDATITPAKNDKPTLMVFVVGETARSQNITYNGYHRNTTPYTENMGLISFKHVQTCGTATAVSLPCLFSNMNRTDYNKQKANKQDNVLDILSHAGVDVHWIDNDGGDKQVAKNLDKIDINKNDNSDLCNKHSCYDQVLLRQLPRLIAKQPGKDKLFALHLIGSHGPTYYQRYPQNKTLFKPACERSDIENCSDQEIVNVYDNSIAYTDYVLAETITLLMQYQEEYNVALFYLSDHGESLGENGLYLHGTPYVIAPVQQTHVPWFMWANEAYFTNKDLNKACLEQKAANDFVSHDNLFHTLLGFYGVKTKQKNKDLDITYSCKA